MHLNIPFIKGVRPIPGIVHIIIVAIVAILIGSGIGYIIRKKIAEKLIGEAEFRAKEIVTEADREAESVKKEKVLEAQEEVIQIRKELDKEARERRTELQKLERRNQQKEETLDKRALNLENKEEKLSKRLKNVEEKENKVDDILVQQQEELERVADLSQDEAKELILKQVEKEVEHDTVVMIKKMEERAKEEVHTRTKEILVNVIQKYAAEYVAETTVSIVGLPNDEMKGRIIGREGRNIRTLETLTGVDIIIDDTPEAVILSSFDPFRREIARVAIEKLIVDGRIHPTRIEEMVEKSRKEIDQVMKTEGENVLYELNMHNVHPELVRLLGRLRYRTSYGQNVLKHSIEVAHFSAMLAKEVGANVKIAKRAGLFHDIGKAVDQDQEGTHVELGMELLARYKESKAVVHAMSTHHGDYEPETLEAVIVTAADAISAARPGARRETLDTYIKRLESLERIANSYDGVEKSFAIQAGREIRVIVKPNKINDDQMFLLARNISKNIEADMDYPGNIKVHVVRESRVVDYAK